MSEKIKIGILRETKIPPDNRVPLTPSQIITLKNEYPDIEFFVQPSKIRCFRDKEYETMNIPIKEDLSSCDILMGVKEVNKATLIPGKTYIFFAHVAKKQPYNREMLREIVNNGIRLIDYEYLTNESSKRVVAFGRWAGIIGAYHGIRALGLKTKKFELKPPHNLKDLKEMWKELNLVKLEPGFKILVTGRGRVAHGAVEVLNACKLKFVNTKEFMNKEFDVPVVCQLSSKDYFIHENGNHFNVNHFHQHPEEYTSLFLPYTRVTDLLITGHFWDPRSSALFTKSDMKRNDFKITVVADITCDIDGSIPCTIKATTIDDPLFCYDPELEIEVPVFSNLKNITVMSIDNLASELPMHASFDFGKQLINNVLPDLLTGNENGMIERATITRNGGLTSCFEYLADYLMNP
jgi:alanine dehydrogenase